jgi:tRNA-splicing ligase RtcB
MDTARLVQVSEYRWELPPSGGMRVPGVIFGGGELIAGMDDKVLEQVRNVASLPGVVKASFAMPDAHWGYGFPIGGVAAFDPEAGGVVSAGGVGFDISCGVRTLRTGLRVEEVMTVQTEVANVLSGNIPAGVGSTGKLSLNAAEMDAMLCGGAQWSVEKGFGAADDLDRIEEHGRMRGADPAAVSGFAKRRQQDEMGTLGSGNHYLEVQKVAETYDPAAAAAFGIRAGEVVVTIHCGSRGLGHQVGTEFLREMVTEAPHHGLHLPDRELACAPIESPLGRKYLGAMRAAINCALANRQIITHLTRMALRGLFPDADLALLYDVSHNTCKVEEHVVEGRPRRLFVHRKGATRAFGPGHRELPASLRQIGQPVLVGGTMGTASYILVGTSESETLAFSSSCHGAGRQMSRHQATRKWRGRELLDDLALRGILIRSPTMRGIAEEAPGAYKDVTSVVDAADRAHLSSKVARLEPLVCIKG